MWASKGDKHNYNSTYSNLLLEKFCYTQPVQRFLIEKGIIKKYIYSSLFSLNDILLFSILKIFEF